MPIKSFEIHRLKHILIRDRKVLIWWTSNILDIDSASAFVLTKIPIPSSSSSLKNMFLANIASI